MLSTTAACTKWRTSIWPGWKSSQTNLEASPQLRRCLVTQSFTSVTNQYQQCLGSLSEKFDRWGNANLKVKEQVQQLRQDIVNSLVNINRILLHGETEALLPTVWTPPLYNVVTHHVWGPNNNRGKDQANFYFIHEKNGSVFHDVQAISATVFFDSFSFPKIHKIVDLHVVDKMGVKNSILWRSILCSLSCSFLITFIFSGRGLLSVSESRLNTKGDKAFAVLGLILFYFNYLSIVYFFYYLFFLLSPF